MFTRIEAKNYRCFKEVSQDLNRFEILVGPNGSGKSTFLDVIGFLSDFASGGIARAVELRTPTGNFKDLVYGRSGAEFQLSVEADAPPTLLPPGHRGVRYDAVFGLDEEAGKITARPGARLLSEDGGSASTSSAMQLSNADLSEPENYHYSFLPGVVPFGHFPLPAATWLGQQLHHQVHTVSLDPRLLSAPSPGGSADSKKIKGDRLARMISFLKLYRLRFEDWLAHVRTALPEIRNIDSIARPEDNTRYVMVLYNDDVQVPSWMLSEGTLRLLQLTILAYLPDFHGVYLIEEPENGVHPSALETIYQSLSSIYSAQVLVSSHSPILLNMAKPKQLLCFSKSPDGVKIVRGDEHPALKDWQNEVSLGTLAASGILG